MNTAKFRNDCFPEFPEGRDCGLIAYTKDHGGSFECFYCTNSHI